MTRAGRRVVFVGGPTPPCDLDAAFDVITAGDRTAVVDCLETTSVDCAVVDGTGSDRVATVAAVREAAPSVPIIYTTATPDGSAAAAATRAGATEYVVRTDEVSLVDRVDAVSTVERNDQTRPATAGDRAYGAATEPSTAADIRTDLATRTETDEARAPPVEPAERDAILDRIHAIVSRDGPFEERVEEVLSVGRTALGVEYGTLSRIDGDRYTFEYVSGADDRITAGTTLPLSEAYCEWIVESGDSLAFTAVSDQRPELTDRDAFREYGVSCFLGVPITVDGDLWGTLCFFARTDRPTAFSDWERTIAELLANWVGHELAERSRRRELERVRSARDRTLDRLDDAVIVVDEGWAITELYGRAETVLTREDAVGTAFWDAVPEAIGATLESQYRRAMTGGTPVTREEYVPALERWLQLRLYPTETGLSVYISDVTERRERNRELERYETILETIDDGVIVVDSDLRFVHVNDAFADLVGAARERLVGRSASSIVDADDCRDWTAAVASSTADGTRHETFETELRRVDGGTVRVEANVTPLSGADPDDVAFVCVVRDVSERRRRADVVTGLLETTRSLFACESRADVADVVVDAAERVLGFDLATVRLYDADADDLVLTAASETIGERIRNRTRVGLEEGPMGKAFRRDEPVIIESLGTNSPREYDQLQSGVCVPIGDHGLLNVGSPVADAFDDQHVQLAQLLTASAAAALERAERGEELLRHERILETVEGMVYALDGDARLTLVTEPLVERLGYERDELIGEPVSRIFADESYDRAVDHVRDLLADPDGDSGAFEATYTTADGERFPVEIECSLLPHDDGEFNGTVSVVRDITQRKEREQYLQVLNRVLRHTLRNDLTVVVGYAELLRERLDDPELAAAADTLRETAADLAGTSEKTRAIQYALDRDGDLEPIDVAAVATETVEGIDPDDATLTVSTAGDPSAWADPGLGLVVENLVENAIRHAGPAPTVEVAVAHEDCQVTLAVADDGPGIPPAEIDVVTGETDITQLTHSSGLGLWLVRWMVDNYGGSVSFAESDLGGSRVEIALEPAPSPSDGD